MHKKWQTITRLPGALKQNYLAIVTLYDDVEVLDGG
jgi:hypothetical protein